MPPTDRAERLKAIRNRLTAATPGPWYAGQAGAALHSTGGNPVMFTRDAYCCDGACRNLWAGEGTDITRPCAGMTQADAELCAGAPADLTFLLAELDAAEQAIHDLCEESAAHHR